MEISVSANTSLDSSTATSVDRSEDKVAFIPHLHGFRGFAILNIVAAHAWSFLFVIAGGVRSTPEIAQLFAFTETFFHGTTLYFALISGLLYSLVLRNKSWATFFRSKAMNVVLPYVLLSTIFTVAFWGFYLEFAAESGSSTYFPVVYLENLLLGRAQLHFWYVPVLLGLFALTPVLDYCLHHAKLKWLAACLVATPLFISRTTVPDLLSVQTLVFFTGAYTLGMFLGMHYTLFLANIAKYIRSIWLIAIVSTSLVAATFLLDYVKDGIHSHQQTLVYVQKIVIAVLAIHYFAKYENAIPRLFNILGSYAFAIYFLHATVAYSAGLAIHSVVKHVISGPVLLISGGIIFVIAIAVSLLVAMGLKQLLGKRSRWLVGA